MRSEKLGRLDEGLTPLRGIEVGGQLDDSGVVESGLAVEIASGGVDEESTPHCGMSLLLCQRDFLPGDVRREDKLDVASRSGTRLRNSRA